MRELTEALIRRLRLGEECLGSRDRWRRKYKVEKKNGYTNMEHNYCVETKTEEKRENDSEGSE